ncbi:undecaprenyl-phosphate glucose phosphotransferase [Paenibacillus hamazuiensis]|uniref:undecaprenyl-phosphate glucose phosphotransferase n=1 Tax=Paenibacillus hamazuiensis TaxID=2936508 RepID=UPI00200E91CD|nr:undecaprenyl-phosphate glucose phosphotransferase [Paenibacillus hamazuiensis]
MVRGKDRFLSQVYVLIDLIFIEVSFIFSWWLKFQSEMISFESHLPFNIYFPWSFVYCIFSVVLGYVFFLYYPKRKKNFSYEFFKVIQVHIISLLMLLSLLFITKELDISRHFMALFLLNNIIFVSIYRFVLKVFLRKIREKGYNNRFVLIIGAGSVGRKFCQNLKVHPEIGYKVIGFLDDFQKEHDIQNKNIEPILGTIDQLSQIIDNTIVDEVIIALPLEAHKKLPSIINQCEKAGVRTLIIPDYFDILPSKPFFDNFAGIPLINVRDVPLDEMTNRLLKRAFDIVFSLSAILILSPLLIIIAVGVKISSPGPIIFKQERVGLNRRTFMMYKFRSMRALPPGVVDTGWTTANDPRKTKFGAFLRKTSLDELPQFFNVLLGHMSVVGPRPERPYYVEQFKEEIPKYMIKHHIRPGITGWAQACGLRGDTSIEDRIKHDIYYIENWSFIFDIKIIFKTIANGLINKNAY